MCLWIKCLYLRYLSVVTFESLSDIGIMWCLMSLWLDCEYALGSLPPSLSLFLSLSPSLLFISVHHRRHEAATDKQAQQPPQRGSAHHSGGTMEKLEDVWRYQRKSRGWTTSPSIPWMPAGYRESISWTVRDMNSYWYGVKTPQVVKWDRVAFIFWLTCVKLCITAQSLFLSPFSFLSASLTVTAVFLLPFYVRFLSPFILFVSRPLFPTLFSPLFPCFHHSMYTSLSALALSPLVHNWTLDDTVQWLKESVELPQYEKNFRDFRVNGNTLPRWARPLTFTLRWIPFTKFLRCSNREVLTHTLRHTFSIATAKNYAWGSVKIATKTGYISSELNTNILQ